MKTIIVMIPGDISRGPGPGRCSASSESLTSSELLAGLGGVRPGCETCAEILYVHKLIHLSANEIRSARADTLWRNQRSALICKGARVCGCVCSVSL